MRNTPLEHRASSSYFIGFSHFNSTRIQRDSAEDKFTSEAEKGKKKREKTQTHGINIYHQVLRRLMYDAKLGTITFPSRTVTL